MKKESVKFPVGRFSLTDAKSALVVNSKVEITATHTEAILWIELYPFVGDKGISFSFNTVELRTFAEQLKELYYKQIKNVQKHAGGNAKTKTLNVSVIEAYSSFDFNGAHSFNMPTSHLIGFAQELEFLLNETSRSTYETQRYQEQKKRKKEQEQRK